MTVVIEDLDLPGGGAPLTQVSITLWGAGRPVLGRSISTGRYIGGTKVIIPNAQGVWSADLVPNSDIIPSGTSYKVEHLFGCDTVVSYISVPITGGPFSPQMIEVDAMNSIPSTALQIHADDLLLHGGGIEVDYAELTSAVSVTGDANNLRLIPGLAVDIPDSNRPIWLEAAVPLVQATSGPTTWGQIGLAPWDGVATTAGGFVIPNSNMVATLHATNHQSVITQYRIPPHNAGMWAVYARSAVTNFSVRAAGNFILARAYLLAVRR